MPTPLFEVQYLRDSSLWETNVLMRYIHNHILSLLDV
jgi:hypothetical protein